MRRKGVIYLSTPFSREAADRLNAMGVPAFKIGSGECNNLPLLDHIAKFGKPMIMSTGMNDLASVKRSVAVFEGRVPFALLHCTSMYPTPYEKVRLGAIIDLMQAFPGRADRTVRSFDEYLDLPRRGRARRLAIGKALHHLAFLAGSGHRNFDRARRTQGLDRRLACRLAGARRPQGHPCRKSSR